MTAHLATNCEGGAEVRLVWVIAVQCRRGSAEAHEIGPQLTVEAVELIGPSVAGPRDFSFEELAEAGAELMLQISEL
jgi:hypothetical protein